MFENVKNLVSKKFISDFNDLISVLDDIGFNTYWKVLNGKECGIPQNRERVFVIAVRKDIDKGKMTFPQPFDNGYRLKDILENTVDAKYYLSKQIQERLKITDNKLLKNIVGTTAPEFRTIGQRDLVYQPNGIMGALTATDYKQPKQILQVGQMYGTEREPNPQTGRVYSSNGISPALDSCSGGNRMPKIISTKDLNIECINEIPETQQWVKRKCQDVLDNNGEIPPMFNPYNPREIKDYAPTTTTCGSTTSSSTVLIKENLNNRYYVRKLTPKECWRLMGFADTDINNCIEMGFSDCALYKQAGNSIITNCVELIAEHLYKAQYDENFICYDENFTTPPIVKS